MAGDFNCTLEKGDSTGALNHCRALTELLRGIELRDARNRSAERPGYTHYSVKGALHLDHIYVTKYLSRRKQGIETIVAAFKDHFAVNLHFMLDVPILRGYWKLDGTLLEDSTITEQLTTLLGQLQQQKRCFPNAPMWWDRYCKRRLTRFMQRAQAERHREHRAMESYFSCIYDLLQGDTTHADTHSQLNNLKTKLVNLQHRKLQSILLDTD